MKTNLTGTVTFNPAAKTLSFAAIPDFNIAGLMAVINVTRNVIIYAVGNAATGFSSYTGGVLTLLYDTASHQSNDTLHFVYERPDSDTASGNITTQNLVPNGTATAGSAVEINLNGSIQLCIQTTGTYTGALSVQVSNDGSRWETITATKIINAAGANAATIASGTVGVFECTVGGFTKARVTALAAVTGTAVATLRTVRNNSSIAINAALPAGSATVGAVNQAGTWTVNPGNLANSTAWKVVVEPSAVQGYSASVSVVNTAASNMQSTPKSTACCIQSIVVSNHNATTPYYFKLYDTSTNVTLTTADPKLVVRIPANTTVTLTALMLRMFFGIHFAVVIVPDKSSATGVATANDVLVNIMYL
jgi:hypothetical protein